MDENFSKWEDILFRVPQRHIFGVIQNILCSIFLFLHDIPVANYLKNSTLMLHYFLSFPYSLFSKNQPLKEDPYDKIWHRSNLLSLALNYRVFL